MQTRNLVRPEGKTFIREARRALFGEIKQSKIGSGLIRRIEGTQIAAQNVVQSREIEGK